MGIAKNELKRFRMSEDMNQDNAPIVLGEYRERKEARGSNENSGKNRDASRDEADSGGGACKRQRVS
jgi:hypothetical protein